ncbi:ankyrin repeat domain-containing protein [Roseovarius sp. EL26]|uniref:ankyrin repeat domain-containing protein n=1 Tax=Roseovarius sp. EL26 TaxID=2126672 RepID=UPI000EA1A820|nr:ankyrin repeat domain-containing protein [Roseovarius sp. EL26]
MFKDGDWPVFEDAWNAFLQADTQFLEKLASESDFPHGVDPWGEQRWLSNAISTGSTKSVEWVLSKGVEVNYVDDEGFTVLKTALQLEIDCKIWVYEKLEAPEASTLTIKMIDMLVNAGGDVNQCLSLDYTALHTAAAWSSVEVVRHLLSLSADPFATSLDYDGGRPVDDAKELKRWDVHATLCEAMGLSPSRRTI